MSGQSVEHRQSTLYDAGSLWIHGASPGGSTWRALLTYLSGAGQSPHAAKEARIWLLMCCANIRRPTLPAACDGSDAQDR